MVEIKEYTVLQNVCYTLKGVFRFHRVLIGLLIISTITGSILAFAPSVVLKVVIDQIQSHVSWQYLLVFIIGLQVILWGINALDSCCQHMMWWRCMDSNAKFMLLRVRKVLDMKFERLESPEVMGLCQKAMNALQGENAGVQGMIRSTQTCLSTCIKLVISCLMLFGVSPWIVLIMFIISGLNFVCLDYTKRIDKERTWDPLATYWRKEYYMENTVSNFAYAKEIRLFHMGDWLVHKYKQIQDAMHYKVVQSRNRWICCGLVSQFLTMVAQAITYAYLIYGVLYKHMTIGDFSLYLSVLQTFFFTLYGVFNTMIDIRNQSRQINDFRAFLELPDDDDSRQGKIVPMFKTYEFVFENVSFKYPQSECYALKNLNLTIRQGERLAVVGLNGAGKTTLIKLLCRLYEPTEGRILLNGTDIAAYDRKAYYTLFSPVFQQIETFAFSLAENVSMRSMEETKLAFTEECLRMAGLGEKLKSLSQGAKTQLLKIMSEDGIDLSGGEQQKLALARALYKNAPIVILDEPTSALDAIAEHQLYQDFDKLIGNKTAIYISHRLSSTRFCDHVAMFAEGKLIEYGTHEHLLEQQGSYAEMFEMQAQYYKEQGGTHDEAVR